MDNSIEGVEIGFILITFDKWNDVDLEEMNKFFERFSEKEKNSLNVGDFIWRDESPYHKKGGVLGFTLLQVINIIPESDGIRIYTSKKDYFILSDERSYKVKPEFKEKLESLIKLSPKNFSAVFM